MERIMQCGASSTIASQQQGVIVLPLDVWSIIFEESARDAELNLTLYAMKKPFNINAKFVNVQKSLLWLCTTSREAIFKHLVLFIDVPDVTGVRLSVPSTILNSIRQIKRTLTIASKTSIQTYKKLDVNWFPALQKLDVLVRLQLRRNSDNPLQSDLSEEEMRKEADYRNLVFLAGDHFTRGCKQSVKAADYDWAKYWKSPQLKESITNVEDNLGELPLRAEEKVNININYELTYVIRLGSGYLARFPGSMAIGQAGAAPAKAVVVSWKTKFPTHEITEKEVIDA
jgi:hypothetical protein